ncbi:MAG: mechanosensitive ion channel family protein [Candidatus Aminicenantia bacterium]
MSFKEILAKGFSGIHGEIIIGILIITATYLVAKIAYFILNRYIIRLAKIAGITLVEKIIRRIKIPFYFGILIGGFYFSIRTISIFNPYQTEIKILFGILTIAIIAYLGTKIVRAFGDWYAVKVAPKTKTDFDEKYLPFFIRVINIVIYGLAIIIILGQLGIQIGPLVASVGIAGIAVALALQETLSNLFAGAYIIADRPISPGDYVEIEGGLKGYVHEIGWRTTKIRTLPNNFIIIPNSKLTQSIITNYYAPETGTRVVIPVGVSYESDLDEVEKVTIEVAKKVMKETPGGDEKFEPFIRYNKFDDFSINFSVILQVEEIVSKYLVTHNFIKELTKRYRQEGIEIPFPIRTIYLEKEKTNL